MKWREKWNAASSSAQCWIVAGVMSLLGALLRLPDLSHPHVLMFDETYYVKDAYALSHLGYEGTWGQGANPLFVHNDMSALSSDPAFIVHPHLGKWLISMGMTLFGANSSFGWRLMPALAGIVTITLVVRLMWRLISSPLLAGLAGLFVALDGVGISESRIALLDVFLAPFALGALLMLLRDREEHAAIINNAATASRQPLTRAPHAGARWWLIGAGVMLGLACSVKWSALYMLAVVGIMVVVWDTMALKRTGMKSWLIEGVVASGIGDFVRLVPTAFVVYMASWFSWFTHPLAYGHGWAASQRQQGLPVSWGWLPDSLRDLLHYHELMYTFHVNLESEHPYASNPLGWLVQSRPTSFFWPSEAEMGNQAHACGADRCVQAITSIGNIPMWWAALVALVVVIVLAIRWEDWRAWVILSGYLGFYVPWLFYMDRTIFTFYTVAFMPFVAMALAWALGWAMGIVKRPLVTSAMGSSSEASTQTTVALDDEHNGGYTETALMCPDDNQPVGRQGGLQADHTGLNKWGLILSSGVVASVVIFTILWLPLWTGRTISYDWWYWHMWLDSWI